MNEVSYDEWLEYSRQRFWDLHLPARDFFGIYKKRVCSRCKAEYRCKDCEHYPFCPGALDWKWKEGCLCPECQNADEWYK